MKKGDQQRMLFVAAVAKVVGLVVDIVVVGVDGEKK